MNREDMDCVRKGGKLFLHSLFFVLNYTINNDAFILLTAKKLICGKEVARLLNLQKVRPVEEDVLQSIMQFYIYEFSKYIPTISLGTNGQYGPFNLKKYWDRDNFHAFFKVRG